ncbi:hypothetical protein Q7C09_12070, partial [Heyndrickxia coagulans]|uniref:hypothetical protein n=1 Tax=Heyndrickxia coagulans TaxID=1398 RepID=UPI002810C0D4
RFLLSAAIHQALGSFLHELIVSVAVFCQGTFKIQYFIFKLILSAFGRYASPVSVWFLHL